MSHNNKPQSDITLFAETDFRNRRQKFGIRTDDRRRHMYILGKTGMGKSTLQENLIYQDIVSGKGVALIDPHGDFVEKVLDYVPKNRINDVIYFNPGDIDYPIAFNIMESLDPKVRHIVASGIIGVFKKLWADSWGPRLEYLLRNAILAVMDIPGGTILGIMRVLVDKEYRKKAVAKIDDPIIKNFWTVEYAKYSQSFQVDAISPIQNKVGQFLSVPMIRNILGQVKSSINIREIMDSGKILLINLSKGRIGEDYSMLLGSLMVTKIQLAAMERVDIPEEKRKDFYLYVDEFQNFATESFANILSEARKYRLNLIIAHQYIEQLVPEVKAAVFGNVGTIIVFRVGSTDAEELVKEFSPIFSEEDLVNITKWHMYLKLMIDGIASDPFSAIGLPPLAKKEGHKEKIINLSRERYATERKSVEDKIIRWIEGQNDYPREDKKNEQKKQYSSASKKIDADTFSIICSSCGTKAEVNFKPDGVRPVYCKNCIAKKNDNFKNYHAENKTFKEKIPDPTTPKAASRPNPSIAPPQKINSLVYKRLQALKDKKIQSTE